MFYVVLAHPHFLSSLSSLVPIKCNARGKAAASFQSQQQTGQKKKEFLQQSTIILQFTTINAT